MGTEAETIRVSARPAGLWTAAVLALAVAALIMSAMALTVAARDRAVTGVAGEAVSIEAPLWDAAKLEAMEGRMLAESVRIYGRIPRWDAAKLEAMESRMLAESVRNNAYG